jgi:hypothetical protein
MNTLTGVCIDLIVFVVVHLVMQYVVGYYVDCIFHHRSSNADVVGAGVWSCGGRE